MAHARTTAATLATVAAFLALSGTAQAGNQVQLSPSAATLLPGETLEVTITGSGFETVTVGGGLSLQWNPDVLDLLSVVVDAPTWEFARNGGLHDAASGTLSDLYFASFIGRSGSFAIATLRFVADRPGSTGLAMSGSAGFPFSDEMAEVMSVHYSGASVGVVPEPASALLLLGGLAAVAARRRGGC
jgi:hypothetical protein